MVTHSAPCALASAALWAVVASTPCDADSITFDSLLEELTDRAARAELPQAGYTCRQFSSYDRRSTTPQDQSDAGWFANGDAGNFLRFDVRDGRREAVMMDAEGPGAVVRIWSANPKGTLRIYLDDQPQPVIEAPMAALLNGEGVVPPPLAANRARGANLYLPIPYAKKCIITTDDWEGVYYQINFRTYDAGEAVETLTQHTLRASAGAIAQAGARLLESQDVPMRPLPTGSRGIGSGQTQVAWEHEGESGAITALTLRITPGLSYGHTDLSAMLRAALLRIEFDGEVCVECPLGDFFGAAPGQIQYTSWPVVVAERGFISRWFMPFENSARISITNHGLEQLWAFVEVETQPCDWTDRSMHFHANWRIEEDIPTRPRQDWNYLEVEGSGVYVGDALFITNPVEEWWGEGDEKIYVDGEEFPSHFGTGTEDYYGYAWCSPDEFEAPLHNQTRCDGPGNYGHTSINRFRALDAIPFDESLTVDMEVWHWRECEVTYAVTTYWYGRPGATSNVPAITPAMVDHVPQAPPLPPPFTIEGAIEGESLRILGKSGDFPAVAQALWKKDTYSGDTHLWVQARQVGDWIEVDVPVQQPGKRRIVLHLTKSWDYAIIQPYVNGEKAGEPIDTFNGAGRELGATGAIDLGEFEVGKSFNLRLEIAGKNPAAATPGTFFGLDCVEVK